jgi:hypothetical protein
LGYFNEKSREQTERVVKVILEEEAKNEGKTVDLVSKPHNLDEIDSNNWYSSKNRVEREQKSDADEESQSKDDTERKFENENGANWYWFCSNNPVCFVDPEGTTAYMTVTAGVSGYVFIGGLGFGVQAGLKGGGKIVELLSKGLVKGIALPKADTIYDLEGLSTTASAALFIGADFNLDDPQHPIDGINFGSVGGNVAWNWSKVIPLNVAKYLPLPQKLINCMKNE